MTDRLSLYNQALALVEQEPLRTPDDQTLCADECRLWYVGLRDKLQRAYPWSFTSARARLAQDSVVPAFGRSASFPWPSDCLAVRTCPDLTDDQWEVEGFAILADASAPLNIKYTRRVDLEGLFDPLFSDALAHLLAERIAPRVARSSAARIQALGAKFQDLIIEGWAVDAIMGPTDRFLDRENDPFAGLI
jgi:hypothetical protein